MTTLTAYFSYNNDGLIGTVYAASLAEARQLAEAFDSNARVLTAWEAECEDELAYDKAAR